MASEGLSPGRPTTQLKYFEWHGSSENRPKDDNLSDSAHP